MRHARVWKGVLSLAIVMVGAAVAVPLYRYADRDDAPGGMVIALLIFALCAVMAMRIVNPRQESSKPGSH